MSGETRKQRRARLYGTKKNADEAAGAEHGNDNNTEGKVDAGGAKTVHEDANKNEEETETTESDDGPHTLQYSRIDPSLKSTYRFRREDAHQPPTTPLLPLPFSSHNPFFRHTHRHTLGLFQTSSLDNTHEFFVITPLGLLCTWAYADDMYGGYTDTVPRLYLAEYTGVLEWGGGGGVECLRDPRARWRGTWTGVFVRGVLHVCERRRGRAA
ncbi:uncharacterized protein EV422DRAFT_535628 [Fimicolochytrium jonesii]|uniref:uncharacterized protein n=1 Tax=Fimicolochytrium jonesii TaxID=1396493 RepID=UPI0022FEE9E0|nr:uncharacterized protein EV422DRAFT_535628 [Fimicolochytrium jonesii]KAI8819228.1 hypothetical protein EV422DRAFT_535628 [Fimicolochytrium jonesii]